jgi:hypothetical protein
MITGRVLWDGAGVVLACSITTEGSPYGNGGRAPDDAGGIARVGSVGLGVPDRPGMVVAVIPRTTAPFGARNGTQPAIWRSSLSDDPGSGKRAPPLAGHSWRS